MHVSPWGVYAPALVTGPISTDHRTAYAKLMPSVQISNDGKAPNEVQVQVSHVVFDSGGSRVPGAAITTSVTVAAGATGFDIRHKLCNKLWHDETFPADWGKAIITTIVMKKRQAECGNYWGIGDTIRK